MSQSDTPHVRNTDALTEKPIEQQQWQKGESSRDTHPQAAAE